MKEYTVSIRGVEHTMMLSDEDAKRYKAIDGYEVSESSASSKSSTPANKSRS